MTEQKNSLNIKRTAALGALGSFLSAWALQQQPVHAQEALPRPEPPFKGKIERSYKDSVPDFPKEVRAPKGAPNVLLILTDDTGFGASSTFGGPVSTPNFDRLAQQGLRYNQFHTTALSSPTRAALITGRNHHSCATGVIMELATGYPGYNSLMSKSCGTIGQILRGNGYNTSWFGKNHNVPDWQSSQAGPFDYWPTSLGFEYFYGFIGGDTNQWAPALFDGTRPIEAPADDPTYILDRDLADHAITWIRQQHALAPDKPYFAYYAPGTSHAPHHAPKEWIQKFKGQYDQGWDKVREETLARQKKLGLVPESTKLTARPKEIAAWNSLNADQKKLYAHMMEVYAGALAYCDNQVGRILKAVDETGERDNTLIILVIGDNGASGEGSPQGLFNEMTFFNNVPEDYREVLKKMDELGGPKSYNHYPVGWAHAMDSPMQWCKQIASHYGGTRNGLVISWPKRIADRGGIRSQWHHTIDITPTILEAAGLPEPSMVDGVKQRPMEGVSMLYSFDNAAAPSKRNTQYFELMGNRGIYHDGWVACTTPKNLPWVSVGVPGDVVTGYSWELYHTKDDFSEAVNIAAQNPEKLKELQELFWKEAAKYQVLPLDDSRIQRLDVSIRPSLTRGRNVFTYYPGMVRIPEGAAPDVKNKSFSITAEVTIPQGGASGCLVTHGGRFAGYGLMVRDSVPSFIYNLCDVERTTIVSPEKIPAGRSTIRLDFTYDGGGAGRGGTAALSVNGRKVAEKHLPRTMGYRMSLDETFDVGEDTGTPVDESYRVPFRFKGTLEKLVIELKPVKAADRNAVESAEREGEMKKLLRD